MTWFTHTLATLDQSSGRFGIDSWTTWPAAGGLGSAIARGWSWDTERSTPGHNLPSQPSITMTPAGVSLRAPRQILARMAWAADALGRSESDIWVEAAREWLARHESDGSTGGSSRPTAASYSVTSQRARRSRVWRDIDSVLDRLRDTTRDASFNAQRARDGEPGAA
jgi:hypothetical protein